MIVLSKEIDDLASGNPIKTVHIVVGKNTRGSDSSRIRSRKRCIDKDDEYRDFLDLVAGCDVLDEIHLTVTPLDRINRPHRIPIEHYKRELELLRIAIKSHRSVNHIIIERWAYSQQTGHLIAESIFPAITENTRIKSVTINPKCCRSPVDEMRDRFSLQKLGNALVLREPLHRLKLTSFDLGPEVACFLQSFTANPNKIPQIIQMNRCSLFVPDWMVFFTLLESRSCSLKKVDLGGVFADHLYAPEAEPDWNILGRNGERLTNHPLITRLCYSLKKNESVSTLGLHYSIDIYRIIVNEVFRVDTIEEAYTGNHHLCNIIWQKFQNWGWMGSQYCAKFFVSVDNNGIDERGVENEQPDLSELLDESNKHDLLSGDYRKMLHSNLSLNKHNNKKYVACRKALHVLKHNFEDGVFKTADSSILLGHAGMFFDKARACGAIDADSDLDMTKFNFYFELLKKSDISSTIINARRHQKTRGPKKLKTI